MRLRRSRGNYAFRAGDEAPGSGLSLPGALARLRRRVFKVGEIHTGRRSVGMVRSTQRRSSKAGQKEEEKRLLEGLSTALSAEEVHGVLAGAVLALDASGRERLYRRLGEETRGVLRALLEGDSTTRQTPAYAPSSDKIRERWAKLWADWSAATGETGSEDGCYVIQEHHWEPPYLDVSGLAHDLERIAAEMRKLLPKAIELGLEPGLDAAEVLGNLDDEVGAGLPEWMDAPEEHSNLGPEVTRCILEWERLSSPPEPGSAFALVDRIRRAEAEARAFGIDGDTITRFALALGEPEQREILAGIEAHRGDEHWAEELQSPHSSWFQLRHALAKRWEPHLFEEISRRHVARNWTLAPPLVSSLLRRRRYEEALAIVETAITAYLGLGEGGHWDPCRSLLASAYGFRYERRPAEVLRLLESWRKISSQLGREEESHALELQIATARAWADGDAVLAAMEALPERFAPLGRRLFEEWRHLVAYETLGPGSGKGEPPGTTWVHGLVDAAASRSAPGFRGAVTTWLGELAGDRGALIGSTSALAILTRDVWGSGLKRRAPALGRALDHYPGRGDALQAWRRRVARRLGAAEVQELLMDFWTRNIADVVPDPGSASGDYSRCADWLAALYELNVAAYRDLLADWTIRHARRKNLWRDIAARKLPRDTP
jgi:hypothetical protein